MQCVLAYLRNSYSLFSSRCCRCITSSIIARSSGVKWDKSGLLGATPDVDPVDELPGPKPELVEAAKPESDWPPPELPMLLPNALKVAARVLTGMLLFSCPGPPPPLVEYVTPMEWPAGEEVMMRGGGGSVPDMELTADRLLALAVGWLLVAGVECINMTSQELTKRSKVIPNSNVIFFLVSIDIIKRRSSITKSSSICHACFLLVLYWLGNDFHFLGMMLLLCSL